jgi:hypothetical protein
MRDHARLIPAVIVILITAVGTAWPADPPANPRANRGQKVPVPEPLTDRKAESADPPAKEQQRVKETTQVLSGDTIAGVVSKINKDEMTVVEFLRDGTIKEHRLLPIDILRDGDYIYPFSARYSYHWRDVKAGDTVDVMICHDRVDKEWYCMNISIERRPKAKLPKSQRADDDWRFAELTLLNDIDNGEDVSDADIAKAFPSRAEKRDPSGRVLRRAVAGGLTPDYQAKLDAIRAKKDKDLKATPPDKK